MKKKILCGLLCLGLCMGSVQAAESSFADVKDSDWFAPYVSICAENGLMNGTGKGNFSPDSLLTEAECSTLALRLFMLPRGGDGTFETAPEDWQGPDQWWRDAAYTAQLWEAEGLTFSSRSADRNFFVQTLALTTEGLGAINSITALPDTSDEAVLAFYNAGILTGVDSYGTFAGDRNLTRSEAAAMIARILEPSLRLPFTPQTAPAKGSGPDSPKGSAPDSLNGKVAMVVNGQEASVEELCSWIVEVAYYWDSYYYNNYGIRLSWDEQVEQAILRQARDQLVAYRGMAAWTQELGCEFTDLAAALTPSPSREALSAYVQSADLLCAKHILVADEVSAESIITALNTQPTMAQFDNILSLLGTDPGMTANPNGYLFTAGEMVEVFESAVRALEIGGYSAQPVQSDFGFHVILRLDPLDHPDLVGQYQEEVMNDLVDRWVASASVQVNEDVVSQIDMEGTYNAYLQSLAAQQ